VVSVHAVVKRQCYCSGRVLSEKIEVVLVEILDADRNKKAMRFFQSHGFFALKN